MIDIKEPLHETVLRVIHLKHPERPAPITVDDVLWKIEDPAITKPKVKEVMDWLANKGELQVQSGKYQLDRVKYLELKKQYKELCMKENRKEFETGKTHRLVDQYQTEIDLYQSRINQYQSTIDNYLSTIKVHQGKMEKHQTQIEKQQTQIEQQQAKVDQFNTKIEQFQLETKNIGKQNQKLWITLVIIVVMYSLLLLYSLKY